MARLFEETEFVTQEELLMSQVITLGAVIQIAHCDMAVCGSL